MGQSSSRAAHPAGSSNANSQRAAAGSAPAPTLSSTRNLVNRDGEPSVPSTTAAFAELRSSSQTLRRRRSSSNTQASLPPRRRRRLPQLRFWSRGTESDLDALPSTSSSSSSSSSSSYTSLPSREAAAANQSTLSSAAADRQPSSQSLSEPSTQSSSSLGDRFIEELDDIASHLSHSMPRLVPASPSQSRSTINSDVSATGPISFEQQTQMLSRLLEVAATSTVVTLMGSSLVNGRRFDNTSRGSEDGSDTTFQEFVSALRNGLLTTELSRNYHGENSDNMTFFRAFRFDSDVAQSSPQSTHTSSSASTSSHSPVSQRLATSTRQDESLHTESSNETAAIPVMIIGVRSVQQSPEALANPLQDDADWFVRGNTNSTSQQNESQNQNRNHEIAEQYQNQRETRDWDRRDDLQEPHPHNTGMQRSWVIFVMGNLFSWNHPLLSAPSLMNENPTYEDLLNLQELIGQVKPQVTTKEELGKHDNQLFELQMSNEFSSSSAHVPFPLMIEQAGRCQICLTDYEDHDIIRKLSACDHFYHQECIDTWLLKGKNNCPLCRSKGIAPE